MTRMARLAVSLVLSLLPSLASAQPTDEVRYFHLDAIGSVRMVTDASGQVFNRHDYLPFGEEWLPPAVATVRRFAGKERDPETGFDYFGGRYYRGESGRFTTVDPELGIDAAVTDPQRWNRYSYVGNRPTQLVDPDGRGWASALFKLGKAVVKGSSIASEFAGTATDLKTLADSDATLFERGLALGSLATEVALPISGRDTVAIGLAVKTHWRRAANVLDNAPGDGTLVIGRTADLQRVAPGERTLLGRLTPDLGDPQANWKRNAGVLREEMRRGRPIRDASPGDTGGVFLNAERALLADRGWKFNAQTGYWHPPF